MGWWSLKKELFTYFFITSTVILIFLGIILYSVMDRTIYERVQKDQKLFLENQLQLVDSNLSLLENLILKVSNDSNLQAMMQVPKSQADTFSESSSRFYMTLENYMQPIEKYISVLHIEGNNGLKVRKGFESYLIDKEDYEGTEWYRKSMDTTGAICWWEMQKNFTRIPHVWVAAPTEYIVPIYKKICRSDDMEILGDMVVFISPSLFFGEEYHPFSDSDTHSYLVDASGQIVYSDDEDFINRDSGTTMNLLDMEPIELERSNARQTRIQSMNGRLVVYRKSSAAFSAPGSTGTARALILQESFPPIISCRCPRKLKPVTSVAACTVYRRLISAAVLFRVVMERMAAAMCSGAASPTRFAVHSSPTPSALVSSSLSPGWPASFAYR